ncbi:MAG: hypothetical protein AAGE18_14860 [Pseudomonadota bacterium]
MFSRFAAIGAMLVALSGCATVTRGTSETIDFTSTPPGATMTASNGFSCTTPCTAEFPRNQSFTAEFDNGVSSQTVEVRSTFGGNGVATTAGNVLLAGGVVGLVVDGVNGSNRDLVPNPVHANLESITLNTADLTNASAPGAALPSESDFVAVGGPAPYEGVALAAFTPEQRQAYCAQDWERRIGPDGRTQFNPCRLPEKFQ